MRLIASFLLMLVSIVGAPARAEPDDAATQALGRELSQKFLAGETDVLWERMTPDMHRALGSAKNLAAFREQVGQQLGQEASLVRESVTNDAGFRVYSRIGRWTSFNDPIRVQLAFDGEDRIAGFFVKPEIEMPSPPKEFDSPNLGYTTKARLRLPFDGEWFVFWGGRKLAENYHAQDRTQRFAYDFVMAKNGASHAGDGKELEDYYAWDQPILAPADGTVVTIVDGLPDQPPGSMDPKNAAGNMVLLDLGNDEYALLAHLKNGSVKVRPGDVVKQGQELGRCGNSGNTTEPHLHFHLQSTRRPLDGDGLPAQFVDYFANEELVERGEPVRGTMVSNAGK